ncbi:discoidin domain-containing protein [Dactylosporangium sp. NPDC006015]|uniref:discoidin domain-containing protein n=1 Tax=Dactylosporangium sp. NPDC006015 TaxID=3154576 RepID=UPI0033A12F5A
MNKPRISRMWRRAVTVLLGGVLVIPAVAMPAPAAQAAVIPSVDQQIESQLRNMLNETLLASANSQLRALTRNVVSRQFDGDTNALLSTVIAEAEAGGIVDTSASWWQSFKSKTLNFVVNGYRYDPQIYIPNFGEGALPTSVVDVAVAPASDATTSVQGYYVDLNGVIRPTPYMIDETRVASYEVWVLGVNEKINYGGPVPVAPLQAQAQPAGPQATQAAGAGLAAACNPTGLRNNQGSEYLQRWRVPDRSSFGSLFEGKREMKLVVIGSIGGIIKTYFFPKVRKRDIDSWQNSDVFITTWDRAVWGNAIAYQWFELDGGGTTSTAVSVPVQGGGTITSTVSGQERDDNGGGAAVVFSESTFQEYDTGLIRFNMCSTGGDGGTGIENLACGAIASASSTFSGYSPSRATDCNPDTRLGPAYSWANNSGTYPPNNPEWLQADFGVNKTFSRVVVKTSAGYPIRDYDIQVWNGISFLTVASVRGNTALSITSTFPSRTARLIRISGRSGPTHQLNYVRVNELEVYAV